MGIVGGLFFHVTAGISSSSVIIGKRVHQKSQRGQGVDAGGCRGLGSHRLKGIEAEAFDEVSMRVGGCTDIIGCIVGSLWGCHRGWMAGSGTSSNWIRVVIHHYACHITAMIIIVFEFGTNRGCRGCWRGYWMILVLTDLPLIMQPPSSVHKEITHCGGLKTQLSGNWYLHLFGGTFCLLEIKERGLLLINHTFSQGANWHKERNHPRELKEKGAFR